MSRLNEIVPNKNYYTTQSSFREILTDCKNKISPSFFSDLLRKNNFSLPTKKSLSGRMQSLRSLSWVDVKKKGHELANLVTARNVSRVVYGFLGLSAAYHLMDNGLANFLALDILKHGTGLPAYLSISLTGADPNKGGTNEAKFSTKWAKQNDCTNHFFVMPRMTPSLNNVGIPKPFLEFPIQNGINPGGSLKVETMSGLWKALKITPNNIKHLIRFMLFPMNGNRLEIRQFLDSLNMEGNG